GSTACNVALPLVAASGRLLRLPLQEASQGAPQPPIERPVARSPANASDTIGVAAAHRDGPIPVAAACRMCAGEEYPPTRFAASQPRPLRRRRERVTAAPRNHGGRLGDDLPHLFGV